MFRFKTTTPRAEGALIFELPSLLMIIYLYPGCMVDKFTCSESVKD